MFGVFNSTCLSCFYMEYSVRTGEEMKIEVNPPSGNPIQNHDCHDNIQ